MTRARYFAEVVRALAVLAVVFLNFAHAPIASAAPQLSFAPLAADSYCGGPIGDDRQGEHAPCHACRIGNGADLPPPCDLALPVRVALVVSDGVASMHLVPIAIAPQPPARGPPLL